MALYESEGPRARRPGLLPARRIPRVKALLADLEALTPENATPTDFVDLGEDEAFEVGTLEGECSA